MLSAQSDKPPKQSVNKMNKFSPSVFAYFYQFACTGRRPSVCLSVSRRSQLPRDSTYIPNYWIIWLKLQIFHCAVCLFVCLKNVWNFCVRARVCVCVCVRLWKWMKIQSRHSVAISNDNNNNNSNTYNDNNLLKYFRFSTLVSMLFYERVSFSTSHDRSQCARALASQCVCVCRVFI